MNRRPLAGLLTRRGLLAIAAGGFGSGLVTRQLFAALTPASEAPAMGIPMAAHILPMEEEPLPHNVHLSAAQIEPPLPLPQASPASPPAAPVALGPDPLIWAPNLPPPTVAGTPAPAPARAPAVKAATGATRAPAAPIGQAAWLRNARPYVDTGSTPAVSIVIDDLGLSAEYTRRTIGLDSAVTLALMTYAPNLDNWSAAARAARHETLVHVPMQPINGKIDPGPNTLTVALSDTEILGRLRWGLGRLEGYVGINNHMGSRFTQDRAGMAVVMDEVKQRGLLFLDSVTIGRTVGAATAEAMHVPAAERNVFLDDEATVAGVSRQIAVLEQVARKHGTAIAIGHPHPATLDVLAQWLPKAGSRGIAVVPLTSVVRRQAMG